jgi:hypothetical protein
MTQLGVQASDATSRPAARRALGGAADRAPKLAAVEELRGLGGLELAVGDLRRIGSGATGSSTGRRMPAIARRSSAPRRRSSVTNGVVGAPSFSQPVRHHLLTGADIDEVAAGVRGEPDDAFAHQERALADGTVRETAVRVMRDTGERG